MSERLDLVIDNVKEYYPQKILASRLSNRKMEQKIEKELDEAKENLEAARNVIKELLDFKLVMELTSNVRHKKHRNKSAELKSIHSDKDFMDALNLAFPSLKRIDEKCHFCSKVTSKFNTSRSFPNQISDSIKEKLLDKMAQIRKDSPIKDLPHNYKNSEVGSVRTSSRASTMRPKRILLSKNQNGTFMNNMTEAPVEMRN